MLQIILDFAVKMKFNLVDVRGDETRALIATQCS